jgi:hypothetical protein
MFQSSLHLTEPEQSSKKLLTNQLFQSPYNCLKTINPILHSNTLKFLRALAYIISAWTRRKHISKQLLYCYVTWNHMKYFPSLAVYWPLPSSPP